MAVLVADFFVRFPAFADVPSSAVEAQLNDAWQMLDLASFTNPTSHARAVMLMAAHNLTMSGLGNTTEAKIVSQGFSLDTVQSVSDGSVSVSLAKDQSSKSAYDTTSFGRELAKLLKGSIYKFAVVGGGPGTAFNGSADDYGW